jgi:hypothetical protein
VEGSASTQPAAHTYDGIHWIPTEGELLFTGGATTCGPAAGYSGHSWAWSPLDGHTQIDISGTTPFGGQYPSGAWDSDNEVFLATGQTYGTQAMDPATDTVGTFTGRWLNTLTAAQPQAVYIPAAEFTTQSTGLLVMLDQNGVYGVTVDNSASPPTPSRWHRCVQNVPAEGQSAATDEVPFDQAGVAFDDVADELVIWNGEAAYYTMPISILDNCTGSDSDPLTWHNTDAASVNFTKHAWTGTHVPQQANFLGGNFNLTYSKFDWFGSIELEDGTVIDNLMVGGNAQAEGIWVMRK